jgi:autotransporter-associated beta strand protein
LPSLALAVLASLGTPSAGFANGSTLGLATTNTVGGTFAYATSLANPNGGANVLKLAKFGPGTLALSGTNAFTGGVDLMGGVVSLGSATPLGPSGLVTFTGGTLQYSSANATDYSSRFSAAAGQAYAIDTNGRDVTFAAALTSASSEELQEVLETVPLLRRMEKVMLLIQREVEVAGLQSQIRQKVEERVSENQRQFFLREQLKEIQQQLGLSKDDKAIELERFRERLEGCTVPAAVLWARIRRLQG